MTMPNFKPISDKLLVRQHESEATSRGGIIIPDAAKKKALRGTVLAAGPGRRDDSGRPVPMDVKVGDVVIFGKFHGTDLDQVDEGLMIISARDVLAIAEEQK